MLQQLWLITILILIVLGFGVFIFARLSPDSKLRRRRRKSHSPLISKARRPTVRFSVRRPKE